MKKILNIVLLSLLLLLVGCNETTKPEPTVTDPTSSETEPVQTLVPMNGCKVPRLEGGWVCTWADEFEDEELDLNKWTYEIDGYGGGNNELQYYTDENIIIEDGILKIIGKKEDYKGRQYTSSLIKTHYKQDFLYGRIQVRAKNPPGKGTWPAIWMMPSMGKFGGWPRSGEIDIMEYVGYSPNYTHYTIHTKNLNHKMNTQVGKTFYHPDSNSEFYVYEIDWSPGLLIWKVDDVEVFRFKYNPSLYDNAPYQDVYPFNEKFYLILNLAIGGDWGGAQGVNADDFPTTFEIDYVRYYQRDYGYVDKEPPGPIEGLSLARLKNTIYWDAAEDDYGVEYYEIYINDEYYDDSTINQYTISHAKAGERYTIQIRAVDFTGKKGPMSLKYYIDGE